MENIEKIKSHRVDKSQILLLVLTTMITLAVGLLIDFLSHAQMGISGLVTPPATAPDVLFAIIRPVVYALAGLSLFFTLSIKSYSNIVNSHKKLSVILWSTAIILLLGISPIFFVANAYIFAFIWICLTLSIFVTLMIVDMKVSRTAWILIIPILAWLCYMGYLSLYISVLN